MFIEENEMKAVLYDYQLNEIAENNDDIIDEGIAAAITEVRAYFNAANARRESANLSAQQYAAWKIYDVDAIFSASIVNNVDTRNKFVVRMVQRVAAYNICELANVDVLYTKVKERYDGTIKTLEKIAGMGEYVDSRIILNDLPSPTTTNNNTINASPFRMTSRTKFNHE